MERGRNPEKIFKGGGGGGGGGGRGAIIGSVPNALSIFSYLHVHGTDSKTGVWVSHNKTAYHIRSVPLLARVYGICTRSVVLCIHEGEARGNS